jgi:quercetin dioxygenase-like cupin family protein
MEAQNLLRPSRIYFEMDGVRQWIDLAPREEQPEMRIDVVGGLWIRQVVLGYCETARSHAHEFDHATLLALGELLVIVDGQGKTYDAPAILTIAAGKRHQIVGLRPANIFYCVHRLDDGETVPRSEP